MAVTVVVGGQFGSEGKGKVAQYLAAVQGAAAAVRVGGSNSGHTAFTGDGERHVFRHLPTAALLKDVLCVLGPGTYIDPEVLLAEVASANLPPERLLIDNGAFIITPADRDAEARGGLGTTIGSTSSGTGASVRRRIERSFDAPTARTTPSLRPYTTNTAEVLRSLIREGQRIIIEGTQGFGLSVLHSPHYPYVTSRDTTAAAAVSEAGLSPLDVDQVALVLRTFPIRVGGNSGPLRDRIDWATLTLESGSPTPLEEFTSVTGRLRKVARFDPEIVRAAIDVNSPTLIVLNHLDYVDATCRDSNSLTDRARAFVASVEDQLGRRIDLLGVGPTALVERPASAIRAA
jgi:adenylosuccinate synthase